VRRLIHVSSLLSSLSSPSAVQRSRAEGELAVKAAFKPAIIVRPSAMFGYEDRLLNVIGLFSAIPLGYPVVNHGKAVRYPMYVGDFTEALLRLCRLPQQQYSGQTFDILGPQSLTLRQLIQFFAQHTLRSHPIVNLPPLLMLAYSRCFPEWRRPVLTRELVKEMAVDEARQAGHLGMAELGITEMQRVEDQALSVIRGFRPVYAYPRPL